MPRPVLTLPPLLAALGALLLAGCGSSSSGSKATTTSRAQPQTVRRTQPAARAVHSEAALAPLPEGRSGVAAAASGDSLYVVGGLSPAGVSTDSVFRVSRVAATSAGTLPEPIHDAAGALLAGRIMVFGGGPSEGSDRIIEVLRGPPRQTGTLPQALSDLVAVPVGNVVYIAGGWNGSDTNRTIYAMRADGTIAPAATLPFGVRYPAAGALGTDLVIVGGETAAGGPTIAAWSFSTTAAKLSRLPNLPVPTDHAAGAVLNGRFYLIGGEREGVFTDAILSWAPGERRWHAAGRLAAPLADPAAVPFAGGIAVIGGRGPTGRATTVSLLTAR